MIFCICYKIIGFVVWFPLNCRKAFQKFQMQGAPEDDTGSVHERTLRMAAEEQRSRWTFQTPSPVDKISQGVVEY